MKKIKMKQVGTVLAVLLCISSLGAGSASYGHITSQRVLLKETKERIQRAGCDKHLQDMSLTSQRVARDDVADQRSKSHALAVGILFGARYASGSEVREEREHFTKALAIKNYRHCLKEKALKS